jgi:hypothetical protein
MPKSGVGAMQVATMEREPSRPVDAAKPGAEIPRKPRRSVRTALLWGALGFFAGAIFWHAIGFWSFVSDVVLNREGGTVFARAAAARLDAPPQELPVIYLVDPASCTALELDRAANRTALRPCPREGLALRLEQGGDREDLAILTREGLQAAGYQAR